MMTKRDWRVLRKDVEMMVTRRHSGSQFGGLQVQGGRRKSLVPELGR